MLPSNPKFEGAEPTTSPALSRRRDYMLKAELPFPREPTLFPASGDRAPRLSPDDFDPLAGGDEPDPEIPPPPSAARQTSTVSTSDLAAQRRHRPPYLPLAAVVISVFALGSVTWLVYDAIMGDRDSGEIPYLTAAAGPEKIRPLNEGGMEVPNQDIRVYNELNGEPPEQEAEVLLPAPEAPVAPPATPVLGAQPATDVVDIPSVPAPSLDMEPAAGSDTQVPATTAAAASDDEPATTAGAFRIQLAAVKTRDAAKAAWTKMTKAHPDVLKGLALDVIKVDRGAEGSLYRVQGGPFASRSSAETACGKLKQKNQDCLVVAP